MNSIYLSVNALCQLTAIPVKLCAKPELANYTTHGICRERLRGLCW